MSKDQRVLFHSTVFGPIHSRRLGTSLGINLGPNDGKVCSFDCLYCEAGFNAQGIGTTGVPAVDKLESQLQAKLQAMRADGQQLDVITFSGNGEPTVHPHFPEIMDVVIRLRDEYYPNAKVSVLSNSTRIDRPKVVEALCRADNNILKLDSAIEKTMRLIDRPTQDDFTVEKVVEEMKQFAGECIIQTMMLRGEYDGQTIDNTTDAEVEALIDAYKQIKPREVMLYSLDRSTPAEQLVKVPIEELREIGKRIETATGIPVQVN